MTTRARRLVLASLGPLLGIFACGERPAAPVRGDSLGTVQSEVIAGQSTYTGADLGDKELVLTFDDGPGPDGVTGRLARLLAARPVPIRATFFVNGANIAATALPNPNGLTPTVNATAVLAEIKAKGHTVANHTTTHRDIAVQVPNAERVQEIAETDTLIAPYTVFNRLFFRAPYGSWAGGAAPTAFTTISGSAMNKYAGPVYWNIGDAMEPAANPTRAADWACWEAPYNYTTKRCGDLYLAEIRAKRKGIVLMHDPYGNTANRELETGRGNTVDMVDYILEELDKEGGWTFKGLEEVPALAAVLPPCNAACVTCSGPGANECTSCVAGKYSNAGSCTDCAVCADGSYQETACSATANTVCKPCGPACETCTGPGANACLTCTGGAPATDGTCGMCSTTCEPGSYVAKACDAVSDAICEPCAVNTFSTTPNADACEPCPAGQYSGRGSTACSTDPNAPDGGPTGPGDDPTPDAGTPDAATNDDASGCHIGRSPSSGGASGIVFVAAAAGVLAARRRRARR